MGIERDIRDVRTYLIIGAAMKVQRALGNGFLEAVYQDALAHEMGERGVPFRREPRVSVQYGGTVLSSDYRPDFVAYDEIIVELKTVSTIIESHCRQVIHYLKATGLPLGLLLNFGAPRLEYHRFINSCHRSRP